MSEDAVCHLTLLRHGRSQADDEAVLEGRYDSPLTEDGRAQVRLRGAELVRDGYQPLAIIASPLRRAHETATILASALAAPVVLDAGWMEMDNGPLAGLSPDQADKDFPVPSFMSPFDAVQGTGESQVDLHARVGLALQRVLRRGAGRYLVVGHGGSLNAALRVALGIAPPVNRTGAYFYFGDVGYAKLAYYGSRHRWVALELQPGVAAPGS